MGKETFFGYEWDTENINQKEVQYFVVVHSLKKMQARYHMKKQ